MTSALIRLACVILLAAIPGVTAALTADEMFADPAKEERAREVGRQLRCLVCQNQSIFDSNAGLAHQLRVVVRERIAAGDTDEEILSYVAERFGEYVLLEPRVGANTYILWLAPWVFAGLGGIAFLAYHRGRQRRRARSGVQLSEADRAAARRLLEKGDTS